MDQTQTWFKRLTISPNAVIANARRRIGDDVSILGNFWERVPHLVSPSVALDVFLPYLTLDDVPRDGGPPTRLDAARLAFVSLVGVGKLGPHFPQNPTFGPRIAEAWPGIFAWIAYFFSLQVAAPGVDPMRMRTNVDTLSAAMYGLAQADEVRAVMQSTHGCVEVATLLWLREDTGPIPSSVELPAGTLALTTILRNADADALDRVLYAVDGDPAVVARIALARVNRAIPKSHGPATWAQLAIFTDCVNAFCRVPNHPLRYAFLAANVIFHYTKVLVTMAPRATALKDLAMLDAMVAAFGIIHNCLESTDGFTWVRQAVEGGLLAAFVGCSPLFSRLEPEDCGVILAIVKNILPRYLVYRSILRAVEGAIVNCGTPDKVAKEAWDLFASIYAERRMFLSQTKGTKGHGATCDFMECQKVDARKNFMQCSACLATYYCSKECQVAAWKTGGHKAVCKLKQTERKEGRVARISKGDAAFFHHLSLRDARRHLPQLRTLAKRHLPGTPFTQVVVAIDYTVAPVDFSVKPLQEYTTGEHTGSANAEARNAALIARARANPSNFVLVESTIAVGTAAMRVLTLAAGAFWESDINFHRNGAQGSIGRKGQRRSLDLDIVGGTAVEEADDDAVRDALNRFLDSREDELVF